MKLLEDRPVVAICVRGLVYAVAIAVLIVFWPSESPEFISQGF